MTTLYMESVALASDVRSMVTPLMRKDQSLGRRLRRACDEVPLHLAEGMSNTGRVRRTEYGAALGSAKEALECVRAAASVGYFNERERTLAERIEQLVGRMLKDLK